METDFDSFAKKTRAATFPLLGRMKELLSITDNNDAHLHGGTQFGSDDATFFQFVGGGVVAALQFGPVLA